MLQYNGKFHIWNREDVCLRNWWFQLEFINSVVFSEAEKLPKHFYPGLEIKYTVVLQNAIKTRLSNH